MQKTVLLIENDPTFAQAMSAALELRGFGVRTSPDGKEGVELARALHPDCVVLCVELPGLSGYSWCNRLKKDDALKRIPLVITSSEATPETFEQHRKLKTRAEDYLLKPFPPRCSSSAWERWSGCPRTRPRRSSSPSTTSSSRPGPSMRRRRRTTPTSGCSTRPSTTSVAAPTSRAPARPGQPAPSRRSPCSPTPTSRPRCSTSTGR